MARKKIKSQTPMKKSNRRAGIKKPITKNRLFDKGLQLIKASRKSEVNKATLFQHSKNISTSSNDSVIIISDNENEHTENVKCVTQNNNKNEIIHSSIGQMFSESKNLKSKVLRKSFANQKTLHNTLNESSDDIVVVWSSITSSSTVKPISDKIDQEDNVSDEENSHRLFMLDYYGNSNNLNCLKSTLEKEQQKKKFNNEDKLLFNKPGLQLPDCFKPNFSITVKPQKNMKRISAKFYGKQFNNYKVQPNKVTEVTHTKDKKLREIIIDGCNVAMAYTHGKVFSEIGLKLVIDYFQQRGHSVKVFVPQHKRSFSHPLLEKLWKEGTVVFTPSRNIGGKNITSYDDRFILEYATICKGIVVSLDQYRDLYTEKPEWRDTIENRLLAPTFVGNYVMFPDDPLGRDGPTLAQFLRHDS
ncbi:PREDICTED: NEDD4-binding protein 1-like isoform X2 [Polistes canadensis]|uniref:NEDD4-binding protein 1-like isoform X2 n=1 Tax=Polistes canadensis TaxID=91411 RepID=UPI000718ACC5|nr:PREDICTED: NEDD4-binding protein 1-like isoform X2 [Polistes canadensis]